MWYDLGIFIYSGLIRLIARFKHKARLWVDGRRGIFERLAATIPAGSRVVWIHAASLGEFEQGRTIIEAIKREHPGYRVLLTFFSPSGYEVRKNYEGADYIFYLPMDTRRNVRRFLDAVNPEIAIFIKYEFWLNYLEELRRRGCRTFIVSAIFRRDSIFFRWYGGRFRRALGAFEQLFVQNEESLELLSRIGVRNVTVAGDTRFDRVAQIASAARQLPVVERFAGTDRAVLIAGSTWLPDEQILLPVMNDNADMGFIVAPHEIEISRITTLIEHTRGEAALYTACDGAQAEDCGGDKRLLVIDTIGLLSSAYQYADFAYVGGGFGAGIHNILEAVTFGLPVAFGPNIKKFKEARDLVAAGVATVVNDAAELAAWLTSLRGDKVRYDELRHAAYDYIGAHTGATTTIMHVIFGE